MDEPIDGEEGSRDPRTVARSLSPRANVEEIWPDEEQERAKTMRLSDA